MGATPRLALLLLAATSLVAVTIDYVLTELGSSSAGASDVAALPAADEEPVAEIEVVEIVEAVDLLPSDGFADEGAL